LEWAKRVQPHKAGWDNDSTHQYTHHMQVRLHGAAQRPSYKKLVHWWIMEVSRVGTISKQVRRIVMVEGAGPRGMGLALPGLCTAPGDGSLRVYLLAGLRVGVG
jgi:hypothetical protein